MWVRFGADHAFFIGELKFYSEKNINVLALIIRQQFMNFIIVMVGDIARARIFLSKEV